MRKFLSLSAVVAAVIAVAIGPAAAQSARADIQATIIRGDVGLSYPYEFSAGKAPDIAYPYRVRTANGSIAVAYCVQRAVGTDNGTTYTEAPWDGISNLGKVNWLLQNGSPEVSNADLKAALLTANAADPAAVAILESHTFTDYETRGVTQWAIWHFTDDFDFDKVDTGSLYEQVGDGAAQARITDSTPIELLYDYLVDSASDVPEPATSLALDPSAASWSGEQFGPITVHTNAAEADLTVSGGAAQLVGADGTAVTTAVDGAQIFVHATVGTSGTTTIGATADGATLSVGRMLVASGKQDLILSQPLTDVATAALDVTLAPQPPSTPPTTPNAPPTPPTLPDTGPDEGLVLGIAVAAFALILDGGVLVLAARRRTKRTP